MFSTYAAQFLDASLSIEFFRCDPGKDHCPTIFPRHVDFSAIYVEKYEVRLFAILFHSASYRNENPANDVFVQNETCIGTKVLN